MGQRFADKTPPKKNLPVAEYVKDMFCSKSAGCLHSRRLAAPSTDTNSLALHATTKFQPPSFKGYVSSGAVSSLMAMMAVDLNKA